MTWTYTGSPSSSSKDEVRFLTGDTDNTSQIVTDEEILYAIGQESNNTLAAIRVVRAILGKYARKVDKSVGDLKISNSQVVTHYKELLESLENLRTHSDPPMPFAGGISQSGKDTLEADADRVEPSFKRGMHDNPEHSDDRGDFCD